MQNIFRDVYADSSAGNLLSVLNSLISIDQQNPRNTAELEYLSNLTWNNMYDLSGMLLRKLHGANAAKTNVLLDSWLAMNPNQQSSAFQEIQRTLLQTTESTRATAISRLGNVNVLLPNKSEADLRDYWLCILTIQNQMIQGNLTLKEFLDEVKNCKGNELTEDLDVEAPLGHEFTELTAGRIIYPNPASDYIRILSDPSKQEGKFELSDLTGRILFEGKLQPTDQNYLEIRLPQLYHGTYILHTLIGQKHQTYKLYIK